MSEKLKVCPFCGALPLIEKPKDDGVDWHIGCWNIYCMFQPSGSFESEYAATTMWNIRA